MEGRFRLKKSIGNNKKGKVFDSYGGLVSGVALFGDDKVAVLFTNKQFFELVTDKGKKTEWPINGFRGYKTTKHSRR